jgi:hypothetical protein
LSFLYLLTFIFWKMVATWYLIFETRTFSLSHTRMPNIDSVSHSSFSYDCLGSEGLCDYAPLHVILTSIIALGGG